MRYTIVIENGIFSNKVVSRNNLDGRRMRKLEGQQKEVLIVLNIFYIFFLLGLDASPCRPFPHAQKSYEKGEGFGKRARNVLRRIRRTPGQIYLERSIPPALKRGEVDLPWGS